MEEYEREILSQLRDLERRLIFLEAREQSNQLRRVQMPAWVGILISAMVGVGVFVAQLMIGRP